MKTVGKIICLCGILLIKLMLCSAADGLSEAELKKIYKLSDAKGDTIDAKSYKIIKGEIIKEATKKIWMKMETSKSLSALMHRLSISKKKADAKRNDSYIAREIEIFKDLKNGKKGLLGECVADMLNHGTYGKKKVLIVSGLGKNLKEYSSKPYSWDDLSKIGPCMIKALRLLHERGYVHRNLKPELFAFGTEEKVAPLKNQVYLFDVGQSEKYKHSNGSHKVSEKIDEFVGEMAFASRTAMDNMTQYRRDDMESIYYVLANLAGFTWMFDKKQQKDLYGNKFDFSTSQITIESEFIKSKIADVRVMYAFLDFIDDLSDLFTTSDQQKEPEYDDFIRCFDQGLSEKEIKDRYNFQSVNDFADMTRMSVIGHGDTISDPSNKTEVVMKLMKSHQKPRVQLGFSLSYKVEVKVYKDLKKGSKHSLFRENICEMLDYGVYRNRRAIIMPRLGLDWCGTVQEDFTFGYPYELLCSAARQAINAIRYLHKQGYIHQDINLENFVFGNVEPKKRDKSSQLDKPLKTRVYLIDFGWATKWKFANNTHKPRVKVDEDISYKRYMCRAGLMQNSQSRRDDMESLMISLAMAATGRFISDGDEDLRRSRWKRITDLIDKPSEMTSMFQEYGIDDRRLTKAFLDYTAELKKLFVSDEPKYFEKEPDYNAFCACFGGKPGNNACATD